MPAKKNKTSTRTLKTTAPSSDTSVQKIKFSKDDEPNFYKCPCCSTGYKKLDGNFPASQSELHAGWDYHLPICRKCLDKLFEHYTTVYGGDEDMAIRRICEKFDMYYCESLLSASRKVNKNRSRIATYISKVNLIQYKDKTYDTTLDEERGVIIESREQAEEDGISITKAAMDRWGVGIFSEDDYALLEEHYKMLKKANPNCDSNQEIFVKSLCHLNLLMMKSLKNSDLDGYAKANSEYGKTFTKAGLKTVQETDKNADDCWGIFMEQISQYTPEEYYKDKKMYEDFEGIRGQFERFVLRPLKNILLKTNQRDEEFNVEDSVDE
ncbi:MAG: hypothetical protein KBT35_05810 [Firmicutes bacterium]|nr:hypothetical protein [Candidatus Colivicinus equi]